MCIEQPLIPIGVIATLGFLFGGLRAMKAGNKAQSQMMMRGRVAAQGLTVVAIYIGITSANESKKSKEPVADVSREV
jgi:small basic protein